MLLPYWRQKAAVLSRLHVFQVLASYINPAGSSSVHTFDAASSDNMNSSALPAMLQELLSQSCLIPAMSSYLRNDSGGCCCYEWGTMKTEATVRRALKLMLYWSLHL